jgi:hypothetical protein
MSDAVTITSLELENVKRVRAVALTPAPTGLTVIGGDNRQGKTSVLDGICYALGGERFRPTNLQREGGSADAAMRVTLSNGITVERKGKNASLKVTDPTGTKGGQKLLDSFIEELALDLPKFLRAGGKDKAKTLLAILGIEDQLAALDREERAAYDERTAQGRIADQKAKYAAEMPEHHDAPEALASAGELVAAAQAVMARNAERQAARTNVATLVATVEAASAAQYQAQKRLERVEAELREAQSAYMASEGARTRAIAAAHEAQSTPITPDESTADIEARMADMEVINAKVRANLDKRRAQDDAKAAGEERDRLTAKVEAVRGRRAALLASADLPLPGLSVTDGELTLNGKAWDCMSSAEQVRAGVAIVRKLKPACGFVLLDGMETFDPAQLAEFGAWLQAEGLQAIATRVSRGEECSIIIEDGLVFDAEREAEDAGETQMAEAVSKSQDAALAASGQVATAKVQDW